MNTLERLCRKRGWRCERTLGRNSWLVSDRDGRRYSVKLAQCEKSRYFLANQMHWQRRSADYSGDSFVEYSEFEDSAVLLNRYLQGTTLAQLLRTHWQEQASPERVVSCMCELAQCIEQLHRSGCVHGDLKPSNVLFSQRVTLLDFAAARAVGEALRTAPYQSYSPHYSIPAFYASTAVVSAHRDWFSYFCMLHIAMFGEPVQHSQGYVATDSRQFEACLAAFTQRCEQQALVSKLQSHHAQLDTFLKALD
ncbi:MAG: protein kinase domain-containing protein [Pseudomonadales bacterium]